MCMKYNVSQIFRQEQESTSFCLKNEMDVRDTSLGFCNVFQTSAAAKWNKLHLKAEDSLGIISLTNSLDLVQT